MPGEAPTGRALYQRLADLLGTETDEELAAALGMSVRQIQRYKAGFGPNQQKLLELLLVAGWLTPTATLSPDVARERAELHRRLRRFEARARRDDQGSPGRHVG